jgi:D-alanyl-lipoteichoic acid acyltransferase DltB (MBOAT superfamily)
MLFNSLPFALFFSFVVAVYFVLPARHRWCFLLGASYLFYMCWRVEYVLLIVIATLVIYWTGLRMGQSEERSKRVPYLVLGLAVNLGLLVSFKYFHFFRSSLGVILNQFGLEVALPDLNVLLPVGISFYTFQTLSYSIDVFRGTREPERHLGLLALYIVFFPQLVAGPIERSTHLMPQFKQVNTFAYDRVAYGLKRMFWGCFKKMVIADRLAQYVDHVYAHPEGSAWITLIIATYFFAFQIYFDFAGYSDMAVGAAKVLGYDLCENFRRPYASRSLREFWHRWHISLTTWFRDYLYVPLGGSRVGKARYVRNVMVVFLCSGLWHGANWTFLLWGFVHGVCFLLLDFSRPVYARLARYLRPVPRLSNFVSTLLVFQLVACTWVFFRANRVQDVAIIFSRIFHLSGAVCFMDVVGPLGLFGFLSVVVLSIAAEYVEFLNSGTETPPYWADRPAWARWSFYYALVGIVLALGVFDECPFLYFQF